MKLLRAGSTPVSHNQYFFKKIYSVRFIYDIKINFNYV